MVNVRVSQLIPKVSEVKEERSWQIKAAKTKVSVKIKRSPN